MSGAAMQTQEQGEDVVYLTNPLAPLELSTVDGYKNTTTTPWTLSFNELVAQFQKRPPYSPSKEGRAFIVGPCHSRRADNNMAYASVAVLDADSKILPDGAIETGAPDLEQVHAALTTWNITHVLYTTYSHGSGKGNRYRILFPCHARSKIELLALLTYITGALQTVSGIPIALTRESSVWSQAWQLPKVSGDQAPYVCRSHVGWSLNPAQLAYRYGLQDATGAPIRTTMPRPSRSAEDIEADRLDRPSVIAMFNRRFSALQWLDRSDYVFHGQHTIIDDCGEPQLVYRYTRPGSSSTAGVVAFIDPHNKLVNGDPNYCIYSHHQTDVLANGHANDSFSCFMLLSGLTRSEAILQAVRLIQESVDEWLNERYPSLGGKTFKVLNQCFEQDGSIYYRQNDWNSFLMSTVQKENVPVLDPKRDGAVSFKTLPDYWKFSPRRIVHDDIVFRPYPITESHESSFTEHHTRKFNTFSGWAKTPYKGEWPLLAEHLFNAMCGGFQREYEYLLNWFSHLILHPDEKPGVALVLRSGKGTGKSCWTHRLGAAAGNYMMVIRSKEQLTGRFNGHLRNCLLAIAEEAFFSRDNQSNNVLKTLISDTKTSFEAKGKDTQSGDSYTRVIMITNDEWAVDASDDERRYFIPTVTDWALHRDVVDGERQHYFPQLIRELENGGIEAFLHDMVRRGATRSDIVNVPNTIGLEEQRLQSLGGPLSWMKAALFSGRLTLNGQAYTWSPSGLRAPEALLVEEMAKQLDAYSRQREYHYSISRQLTRAFGARLVVADAQAQFSSLKSCREAFITNLGLPSHTFNGGSIPLDDYNGNVEPIRSRW